MNYKKEIENLRNKKLLMPKLYNFSEVRNLIELIDKEWKGKIKKDVDKKNSEKHRCIKCGSLFGYVKIKDKAWQCRCCSYIDKKFQIKN